MPEIVLLLAALIVSAFVFTALLNIVKTTVKTAVLIALVVLVVQLLFGIGPQDLWNQIVQLWQTVWNLVLGR